VVVVMSIRPLRTRLWVERLIAIFEGLPREDRSQSARSWSAVAWIPPA
jgi:hypothetical protein